MLDGFMLDEGVVVDEVDEFPVYLYAQQDAVFTGGEIYGDARLGSALGADWKVNGSLDLVDAEFDDGSSVPLIPPVTLTGGVSADWRWWDVGLDVTHAAEQDDIGAGELAVDAYTRLDLRAGWNLGSLSQALDGAEAFVELRNATDEEIRPATSVIRDIAPMAGRNLRLGIKLSL